MTDVLTSPVEDTFLTGTQVVGTHVNVWSTKWKPSVKIECKKGIYEGTFLGKTVAQVEVTPTYSECVAGGFASTVDEEGCKYVLTGVTDATNDTEGKPSGEKATVSLNCGHTGRIKITGAFGCTITLSDTHEGKTVNQNLLGVTYENEKDAGSGKWDVRATLTVDTISYTSTNCGFLGITATDEDTLLTANITFKGYKNAAHTEQVDITQS